MSEYFEIPSRQAVAVELERRLREPAPGQLQVLTGPRQVGKTTLLLELSRSLPNVVYHTVDTPEAALPGWWKAIWREEPLKVDGVLVGSWGKWAVEVKTGDVATRDLGGLFEFCRRYSDFRPLVLCSRERVEDTITDVRLMFWGGFLFGKPLQE